MEQITKMGVLPKNVASQTTTIYIFKAHVGQGGSVQTTPVNKQQLTDIERAEAKEYKKGMADSPEDEAIRAQFEAQYGAVLCRDTGRAIAVSPHQNLPILCTGQFFFGGFRWV